MSGRNSRDAFRRVFLQYVGCDAFRDTLRGLMRRVSREVRVSRRGLSPGVAKEFLYHESPPRADGPPRPPCGQCQWLQEIKKMQIEIKKSTNCVENQVIPQ